VEKTQPVTVDAMVRFAQALRAGGRTRATFTEAARFIGCHHPSVRNWLTGSLGRRHIEELRTALRSEIRVEKGKDGMAVVLADT